MRLGKRIGDGCSKIMDNKMYNLDCKHIEVDEMCGFVGAKKKNAPVSTNPNEYGDIWTWIAIDKDTKLIPCYAIGDRSREMAHSFMHDLAFRMKNRIQISSDALRAYGDAIESAFGRDIDYAKVVKTFSHTNLAEQRRYSPPTVFNCKKVRVQGNPDMKKATTSHVEKQNHTVRMHCRRLSRLTNAFSKKRENLEAGLALHFVYYNFIKKHTTIRCTPAMEAGIEKSFWTFESLIDMLE